MFIFTRLEMLMCSVFTLIEFVILHRDVLRAGCACVKAKVRSQKGLVRFGVAKSGAKFVCKMADKVLVTYLVMFTYAYILQ